MSHVTTPKGPTRIIILGGGFGGVYTAMYLESLLRRRNDVELVLVNSENYFVFQPMLAEIISGNIGLLDTISPIHRLLRRTQLIIREVEGVDLEKQTVTLRPGFRPQLQTLAYDHLVFALGTVTDFRNQPGLREHAFRFKNLADAVHLRNHLIQVLSEASIEPDPDFRAALLTFVIAGGGFSGVEVAAEINDFVKAIARHFRTIRPQDVRVILIHSGNRILERELPERLGLWAQNILRQRGVDIRLNSRLKTASRDTAVLEQGERIATQTVVCTVPASCHPLLERLPLPNDRGRICVAPELNVEGFSNVWAVGDCALIPSPGGLGFAPPTAQHAVREAKTLAENIVAQIDGKRSRPFAFSGLGKMGSLGHRSAVAELFGCIRVSGFLAWVIWRTIYWWKLPGFDRKIKVGFSWFLDFLLPPEFVQLRLGSPDAISKAHFEAGEVVFRQGDLGDSLYIILAGDAEVFVQRDGQEQVIARMAAGEYFGEMALLGHTTRGATVRSLTAMDVLVVRAAAFETLVATLPDMRKSFEHVMRERAERDAQRASSATRVEGDE